MTCLTVHAVQRLSPCYGSRIFRWPCLTGVEGARFTRLLLSSQCYGRHLLTPPENRSQGYRNRSSGDSDGKMTGRCAFSNAAKMASKDIGQRHDVNWPGTNPESRLMR